MKPLLRELCRHIGWMLFLSVLLLACGGEDFTTTADPVTGGSDPIGLKVLGTGGGSAVESSAPLTGGSATTTGGASPIVAAATGGTQAATGGNPATGGTPPATGGNMGTGGGPAATGGSNPGPCTSGTQGCQCLTGSQCGANLICVSTTCCTLAGICTRLTVATTPPNDCPTSHTSPGPRGCPCSIDGICATSLQCVGATDILLGTCS